MDTAEHALYMDYALSTTGAGPAIVHAIRELGSVTLSTLGVRTLNAYMLMCVIAFARNLRESVSIAGNDPRFAERDAPSACCMANQAVHAAIQMMCCAAPLGEASPHSTLAPIHTGLWPLYSYAASIGDACVGDSTIAAP